MKIKREKSTNTKSDYGNKLTEIMGKEVVVGDGREFCNILIGSFLGIFN